MKLTRKSFILVFFLFNIAYIQSDILPIGGLTLTGRGNQTFHIQLEEKQSYHDYIRIILSKQNPPNPLIYISKYIDCKDRFFAGVQMVDPIYSFIKTQKDFYICIIERQNSDLSDYQIDILNMNDVSIPYDTQASYYVYNESIRTMNFGFNIQGVDDNPDVTYWVKGKNIIDATIDGSNLNSIDNGYYFHTTFPSKMPILKVEAKVGDYITFGSTLVTNEKTKELKENANEMMVYSNHKVCFPLQSPKGLSFITGKIYTKRAKTYFMDMNNKILEITGKKYERNITDGIINDVNILQLSEINKGYYCLEDPDNSFMLLSVQMRKDQGTPTEVYLPPLLPGEIQRHYLLNDQMAIFYGMKPNDDALEVNFNMKSYRGFPKMFHVDCTTFPDCHYSKDSIKDLKYLYPSNLVTTYSFYFNEIEDKNYNPISSFQPLMIVYCAKGGKEDDIFGEDFICEFDTTYFTDQDAIKLYQGSSFSQYLYYDEADKYKINLKYEDVDSMYLDLLIFSGDADIILPNTFTHGTANKYYLSNKIFYSIRFLYGKPDDFEFNINATEKTFYMVQYKLFKRSINNDDMNTLDSGINYITSKDFGGAFSMNPKHLEFLNFKYEFNQAYLVTFYSPNCIFDVEIEKKGTKERIAQNINELQQIINPNYDYYDEKFDFYYTIKEDDNSMYSNRMCMVYAAGLELSNSSETWNERSISLSEGVPHRYMFSKYFPFIVYSYQVSDISNKLVINFNLFDKDYFNITININGKYLKSESIYRNSQIFVSKDNFEDKCEAFEVCTVDVKIKMIGTDRARTVEVTMYQLDKNPFYLERNVVKQDVIIGTYPKHYYFDIGRDEYGDITVDFKRGSGNIYAIVEPRNPNTTMNNAYWRGKYCFPELIEESLKYDTYGKKILIKEDNTDKCKGGCYVLITIEGNIEKFGPTDDYEQLPMRISINPRIVKKDTNYPSPKVKIGVNDFIIGNILYGLPENRKYDYYSVILPFDSEQILFDWQADSPTFFINIGDNRPTKDDSDFSFPPIGKDFVYYINRENITKKAGFKNITSIRGLELTIGVYSDVSDSITYSPYAFKIIMPPFMPSDDNSDEPSSSDFPKGPVMHMIHIRSDQKVQCLPFKYKNQYTCLFAVIIDDFESGSDIIVYPRSQDGSPVTIYGKLVNAEEIERNNVPVIMQYVEEVFNNGKYREDKSYAYIEDANKNQSYLFMTKASNTGDIIEILSSSFRYQDKMDLYPNPSTAQIFNIINLYSINLKFSTTRDLLLNIVCVSGVGYLYWENEEYKKFYLNGKGDRLTLTTYTDIEENKLSSLKVNPANDNLIFIITYYPRSNIDQLKNDRSTEFHYRSAKNSLNYFTPITLNDNWAINFNLYEIGLKNNSNLIYDTNLFTVWATIISEETAQKARFDPQYRPYYDDSLCVTGIYDSTFGILYLSEQKIDELMSKNNVIVPNLYLSIEKNPSIRTDFSTMDLEINLYPETRLDVQKGVFITGKLSNSEEKKYVYQINIDKGNPILVIQYSANSKFVNFALKTYPDNENDYENLKLIDKVGFTLIKAELDENIEHLFFIISGNRDINEKLSYFVFRYTFGYNEDDYTAFKDPDKLNLYLGGNDNNYEISFSPIQKEGTSYYIKAYYKDGLYDNEKIDTIAMSESPGAYIQINNLTYDSGNKLTYNLITERRVIYIKVMAVTIKDNNKYYYLYNPKNAYRELIPNNLEIGRQVDLSTKGNMTYLIRLNGNKDYHQEFIIIRLTRKETKNPYLYVAKDEDCMNRLFTGVQTFGSIFSFIKKDQIDKDFYICIKERQTIENPSNYEISITEMNTLSIPYEMEGSYYISDDKIKNIKFNFNPNDINGGEEVTFWVKGKSITNAEMNGYDKKQIDNGYIFYGVATKETTELNVEANIGDYVTIGSTLVNQEKTKKYLEENANEMMVASNNDICLPIKATYGLSFITGKIYTKRTKTYFAEKDGSLIKKDGQSSEKNITNGIINDMNILTLLNISEGLFCLKNLDKKLMIFSLRMIIHKENIEHIILPPLLPGEIQRHYLLRYQMAIFYGMKPNDDAIEVNFNIKSLSGFPEMYYDECKTFPYCYYTYDLIQKLTHPYPSNMATTYSFYKEEVDDYNPISSFQPLMIVYCGEGGGNSIFGQSLYCEFETTYFTNQDTIKLYQDSTFSQYLYYDEEDKYKINLENDNVDLIYLDLLLFSGDADITLPDFKGQANKYYLSSKIFYSIHLDNNKPDSLEFRINATEKTFYMVQYKLLKSGKTDDMNTLESGINYITSKDYDARIIQTKKHLQFLNFKYEFYQPYLVTFYSPNCLFDIYWIKDKEEEGIDNNTYVAQKIITALDYHAEKFDFYYTIKKDDDSQYPKKFCMIYASGLELSNYTSNWNGRSISLSEGVPHRYIFNEENSHIVYSYHVSDPTKNLILNFNLIDKEYFDVSVDINRKQDVVKTTIYRNGQITIKKKELEDKCVKFEVCTVNVRIEMHRSRRGRALEFSMYQLDKNPFYLEKNVVKQDILNGNIPKHYYFDIAKGEYGDITLDFKRGSGNIYASVQSRKLDKPMNNSEWRGKYHFPMTIEESLKYDIYGKKIIISQENTDQCSDGCYVLITIVSNVRYYGIMDDEETPFRISINPRIMKIDPYVQSPKVKINVNDFIIGNIMYGLPENRKYDYYSLVLPYESEQIMIDWQADSPSLIMNFGDVRPTKDNYNYSIPQLGRDFVYVINKTDILGKEHIKDNPNMRYSELTIGVYSDVSDSITSSPYAFKIFMPAPMRGRNPPHDGPRPSDIPSDGPPPPGPNPMAAVMHIIHIRSDQKVQCLPFAYKETNICIFAIIVDDMDIKSSIVVYPRSQDGSPLTIYGKLVNAEEVERNEGRILMNHIDEIFKNDDYKQSEKYVYIENVVKTESFFFIATKGGELDVIEVLSSSFFTFHDDMDYSPNPSTPQIFAINDYKINLNFSTTRDLLINIACVSGRGKFYWEDEPDKQYYLSGFEDRFSLTTYTDEKKNKLSRLKVESSTNEEYDLLQGGFIFIITYYPRSNVDQLKNERSTEFHFRSVKMPLNYFAPITLGSDWNINFNFYDISLKDNVNLEYDTNLFTIWATLISQETVQRARFDPKNRPNQDSSSIKGIYDSTFGSLYLSGDEIKKITDDKKIDSPNIFFSIEKNSGVGADFSTMGFEINIYSSYDNGKATEVQERLFISGKLSNSKENRLVYHLKLDRDQIYLAIQFSANSNLTKYVLSTDPNINRKESYLDTELTDMIGINLIFFEFNANNFPENGVYFIVYTDETNINKQLDYFTFAYFLSNMKEPFQSLLSEDKMKLKVDVDGKNYKISFNPIPLNGTSYYIKAYYKSGFVEGENIETIAISESPGKYLQVNSPTYIKDQQISCDLSINKGVSYIKVLASLNMNEYKIFNVYVPEFVNTEDIPDTSDDKNETEDSSKTLIYVCIGIGCVLLVAAIVLFVFFFLYKNKNKNLLEQVNKISFAESGAQEKEDNSNLLINDDEESLA